MPPERPRGLPALTVVDQIALQSLGRAVGLAASDVERDLAIDLVIATCRRHRDADVRWAELCRAVGVSDTTMRRWRRRDRITKPSRPTAGAGILSVDISGSGLPWAGDIPGKGLVEQARSTRETIQRYAHRDSAESTLASSISVASNSGSLSRLDTSSERTLGAGHLVGSLPAYLDSLGRAWPAVLVLTGDPRRGQNVFDVEVATIRRVLVIGVTSSQHLAMIELGEVAAAVDRLRPVVLHFSAHHELGGVALSYRGEEHLVTAPEIADAIGRADHRPTCVILAFCRSDLVAPQVARTVPAVVSWPADLSDDQGCCFAGEFYGHLSAHRPLRPAFDDAVSVLTSMHPGVNRPVLRSRIEGAIL